MFAVLPFVSLNILRTILRKFCISYRVVFQCLSTTASEIVVFSSVSVDTDCFRWEYRSRIGRGTNK